MWWWWLSGTLAFCCGTVLALLSCAKSTRVNVRPEDKRLFTTRIAKAWLHWIQAPKPEPERDGEYISPGPTIYLVRNAACKTSQQQNPGLSEEGIQQAKRLQIPEANIDLVIMSPLRSSMETVAYSNIITSRGTLICEYVREEVRGKSDLYDTEFLRRPETTEELELRIANFWAYLEDYTRMNPQTRTIVVIAHKRWMQRVMMGSPKDVPVISVWKSHPRYREDHALYTMLEREFIRCISDK